MIEALGLVKRYGDRAALDGVTSRVERGEQLWVTTPSRPGVVFRVGASELRPVPTTLADLADETAAAGREGGS